MTRKFLIPISRCFLIVLFLIPHFALPQHTFSIVAVDSVTGEIGSAGATCGDSIIWPGTKGAVLISDVLPGIGAIHTQAAHNVTNQQNARYLMNQGYAPQEIVDTLAAHDAQANSAIRQYGVIDYNGGHPRSAGFTGVNCMDYKYHILGPNYAIQGNILLGQQILDSMESRFIRQNGTLADKLMATLQGAKVVGADTRCTPEGTSSLSSFLRVAKPGDDANSLFIDMVIAGTPNGIEPIDELQKKYDYIKTILAVQYRQPPVFDPKLFPIPCYEFLHLDYSGDYRSVQFEIYSTNGSTVIRSGSLNENRIINTSSLNRGMYFIKFIEGNFPIGSSVFVKQ